MTFLRKSRARPGLAGVRNDEAAAAAEDLDPDALREFAADEEEPIAVRDVEKVEAV